MSRTKNNQVNMPDMLKLKTEAKLSFAPLAIQI